MKAITLWQPYASAIALGLKTYETRSWTTKLRGTILIHASKRTSAAEREFNKNTASFFEQPLLADPPLGAIIGKADIVDVFPVEDIRYDLSQTELYFGDYDDGRYAWKLENIHRLTNPIPYKGSQGLFTIPDEILVGAQFTKLLNNPANAS